MRSKLIKKLNKPIFRVIYFQGFSAFEFFLIYFFSNKYLQIEKIILHLQSQLRPISFSRCKKFWWGSSAG